MWISKCFETAKKLKAEGQIFLGFDPETSPGFDDYALQSGFPTAETFIESRIRYDQEIGKSPKDSYERVLEEFLLAKKIWNKLVTEQGWTSKDFSTFDDCLLEYNGRGSDTFLSHCMNNNYQEYAFIEYANRCWNDANSNQEPKPIRFPRERAITALMRFDEATQKDREKGLADLHHYTKGRNIDGLDEKELRDIFGKNAASIIYIQGYMKKDEEDSARHRKDLIKQHEAHLNA